MSSQRFIEFTLCDLVGSNETIERAYALVIDFSSSFLPSGKRLILISSKSSAEGGANTTLLHEVTHYMEGSESYKQLAKVAMESYPEEKAQEIRERYRKYAEAHGTEFTEDFINEEVVAEAVGEILTKGKYIARMRNRSRAWDAVTWLGRIAQGFMGKNHEAHEAARRLWVSFTKCLARTKSEAAEELKRYAVAYTTDNRPVAIIEENILDGVPKSQWVKVVKKTLSENFSAGIPVSGRLIKVNQNTRNEYTYSKNSQYYRDNDGTIYEDKFRSAGNLDDIVLASTNYINEDLNHKRKDKFTDFARGDVLIRVDGRDYSAKVIVGFTTGKEMVLHDVIDFERTAFETKKAGTRISQLHNAETDSSRVPENSSEGQVLNMESDDSPQPTSEVPVDGNATTDISIPQSDGVVKGETKKYSLRKNNDIAELYSELNALNERERVYAEQWKKAQASIIEDEEYLAAIEEHSEAKSLAQKRAVRQRMKAIEVKYGIPQLVAEKSEIKDRQKEICVRIDELTKAAAEEAEVEAIRKSGKSAEEYHRSLAAKEFGYTSDFNEAGYLLPNGRLLNFSGEKGRHTGDRGQDHRAVGIVYANTQGTAALIKFMSEGNIRIMAETPGLDVMQGIEPTAEQYAKIRTYVREIAAKGFFNVDITGIDGRTLGSLSYEGRVNPDRVVNDIKTYYRTGEIREQSAVERFRYSLRKTETDAERADRLEKSLKREKSINKQLRTDYDFYQKHGTNPGDIRAWWAVQMEGYTGSAAQKEILTNRMVKNAGRIDRLLQGTAGKNAQAIKSALDKELDEIASEIAFHQAEEQLSEDVKEIRAYLKSTSISISKEYREDLRKEGGYNEFRKKNFGTLRISHKGTPVETLYSELTGLFGEAAFPSAIKNPADQLIQISKSVRGTVQGEAGEYIDYPALQSKLKELYRDDLTALMRRQQKGYNPVWNLNTLHGNYAPYTAFYTYRSVQKIMDEADQILREEAEALGFRREYGARLRENAETELLRRMNAGNRSDMSKFTGQVLDAYLEVQRFREYTDEYDKNGRRKVNTSVKPLRYNSMKWASKAQVEQRLRSKIRDLLDDESLGVIGDVYQVDALNENAGLRDEVESLKAQAALASKIKSLSDLAKGRTKPSERVSLDEMNAVIEKFSKIVYKGRISAKRTQEFILWLNGYLASKEPTGTISYLRESLSDGVLDTLTEFATSIG